MEATTAAANADHNDTTNGLSVAGPVPDIAVPAAPPAKRTLDRLRHATADIHADLDQSLDVVARFCNPRSRIQLVAAYYRFHRVVEQNIDPYLKSFAGLRFSERLRSPEIGAGLIELGGAVPRDCNVAMVVGSGAEALGALYVLEGSAFGGRVILKQLRDRGAPVTGLGFLDPYGERTASLWRALVEVLERETAYREQLQASAIAGAVRTFAFAKATLCMGTVG